MTARCVQFQHGSMGAGREQLTLREICQATGASRRAIQGFEKAGMVRATGRTERGYLLYEGNVVEEVRRIVLMQQMGFRVKEIAALLRGPRGQLKEALQLQIVRLEEHKQSVDHIIEMAQQLILQCENCHKA